MSEIGDFGVIVLAVSATLFLALIGMRVADRKARGVQEIHLQVQKGLQQVGERVHRVAVVPVQRHDDVSGGGGEPALIGAPVAAQFLPDDLRANRSRVVKTHKRRFVAADRKMP